MKNFKKALENQKQVNEAITSIVNYFEQCPYSSCVEYFAEAQTQILKMVKFLQYYDIGKRGFAADGHRAHEYQRMSVPSFADGRRLSLEIQRIDIVHALEDALNGFDITEGRVSE